MVCHCQQYKSVESVAMKKQQCALCINWATCHCQQYEIGIHCIIVTPIWRPVQQPSATALFLWRGGVTSRKWRCSRRLLLA